MSLLTLTKYCIFISCLILVGPAFAQDNTCPEEGEVSSAGKNTEAPSESCSAEAIFEVDYYVGCLTNVNGHEAFTPSPGITEYGCSTFCSSLKDPFDPFTDTLEKLMKEILLERANQDGLNLV